MDHAILYNIILSKHAMSNHLLVSRKGKHPKIVVEDLSREYPWRPLMLKKNHHFCWLFFTKIHQPIGQHSKPLADIPIKIDWFMTRSLFHGL